MGKRLVRTELLLDQSGEESPGSRIRHVPRHPRRRMVGQRRANPRAALPQLHESIAAVQHRRVPLRTVAINSEFRSQEPGVRMGMAARSPVIMTVGLVASSWLFGQNPAEKRQVKPEE